MTCIYIRHAGLSKNQQFLILILHIEWVRGCLVLVRTCTLIKMGNTERRKIFTLSALSITNYYVKVTYYEGSLNKVKS